MKLTSPQFDGAEKKAVSDCFDSGWVTMGPRAARFEELVARRHGAEYAIAVNSCTSALHLAMLALGIGPGDEVVVPAFTWVTTASAVEYVGGRAVFADVSADTCNLDPRAFEAAITPNTKAVIPVHLFGLAADMAPIKEIAEKHGLSIVEDAACAIGTSYDGRPVGTFGDIGCFSFHPRKIITTGEGGMAMTNAPELAETMKTLRSHGDASHPEFEGETKGPWTMSGFDAPGFNFRMSDIQAAVGVAQMEKLDGLIADRRRLAQGYAERLRDINTLALPPTPEEDPGHTYQSFVVRTPGAGREGRNRVMKHMQEAGIETRPGTHAVHRLGYYANKYGLKPWDFPVAAALADETITLPLFPGMTDDDQTTVSEALRAALKEA